MREETREMMEVLRNLPWYENIGRHDQPILNAPVPNQWCKSIEEVVESAMGDDWRTL